MQSSPPSTFTTGYQPTPLEQAYSYYILDVILKVPRTISNSDNLDVTASNETDIAGDCIRLSGRIAVPLLNSSGVDRALLREIWNIVDPATEGSLLTVLQFTALLKLVSLAQQRCLDLTQYEGQLLYRQVPLATFWNFVVPTHQLLLNMYPSVTEKQRMWLSTPVTAMTPTVSVTDAFEDLIMTNAPPTLNNDTHTSVPDEDFGDFEECPTGPETSHQVDTNPLEVPILQSNDHFESDEDFGVFENGESPMIISDNVHDEISNIVDISTLDNRESSNHEISNDEFGDFIEVLPSENSTSMDSNRLNQIPAEYELSNRPNGHEIQLDHDQNPVSQTLLEVTDEETFGDFITTPAHEIISPAVISSAEISDGDGGIFSTLADAHSQADYNDPFDALVGEHNQTLPGLIDVTSQQHVDHNEAKESSDIAHSISTSKGTTPIVQSVFPTQTLEPKNVTELSDTFSSAFDDIQPIQNQPLPSLSALAFVTIGDDDDDHEFGDFEGVENPKPEEYPAEDLDVTEAKIESIDDAVNMDEMLHSVYPVDPIDQTLSPTINVSDLLVVNASENVLGGEMMHDSEKAQDDPFASAFDGIQPIENRPLPPLLSFIEQKKSFEDSDDEDFGDFEAPEMKTEVFTTSHFETESMHPSDDELTKDIFFGGDEDSGVVKAIGNNETHSEVFGLPTFESIENTQLNTNSTSIDQPIEPSFPIDDFGDFQGDIGPSATLPLQLFDGTFSPPPMKPMNDDSKSTENYTIEFNSSAFDFQGLHVDPEPLNNFTYQNIAVVTEEGALNYGFDSAVTPIDTDYSIDADVQHSHVGANLQNLIGSSDGEFNISALNSMARGESFLPNENISNTNHEDESEFGDFTGFAPQQEVDETPTDHFSLFTDNQNTFESKDDNNLVNPNSLSDDIDDWGDFEHVEKPESPPLHASIDEHPTIDTSFADFQDCSVPIASNLEFGANFDAFPKDNINAEFLVRSNEKDENIEDWDSFQESKPFEHGAHEGPKHLQEIKDRLDGLILSGLFSGISIVTYFNNNLASSGSEYDMEKSSDFLLKRAQRCFRIASLLSSSCSNLACSDWNSMLTVVSDDLKNGTLILTKAKELHSDSLREVLDTLNTMILGLAECIRVVRSIIASIGDLLCLHPNISIANENSLTVWGSLDIVRRAIEVESLWQLIVDAAKALDISVTFDLETVQDIRKCAMEWEESSVCHLTLQPVVSVDSTKNEVIWEGKSFMACAANLWSNRISSRSP